MILLESEEVIFSVTVLCRFTMITIAIVTISVAVHRITTATTTPTIKLLLVLFVLVVSGGDAVGVDCAVTVTVALIDVVIMTEVNWFIMISEEGQGTIVVPIEMTGAARVNELSTLLTPIG